MPDADVTKRQVGYLLSDKVSPLSPAKRRKLKRELHSGAVRVRRRIRRGHGLSAGSRRKKRHKRRSTR